HLLAATTDLGHADALGEALAGIQLAEPRQPRHRVRQAYAGKAPTADRGANQAALLRRLGKPVTEHRHIQSLNAQGLGSPCSAWNEVYISRLQPGLTDVSQGPTSRAQSQCWFANMNGSHGIPDRQNNPQYCLRIPGRLSALSCFCRSAPEADRVTVG